MSRTPGGAGGTIGRRWSCARCARGARRPCRWWMRPADQGRRRRRRAPGRNESGIARTTTRERGVQRLTAAALTPPRSSCVPPTSPARAGERKRRCRCPPTASHGRPTPTTTSARPSATANRTGTSPTCRETRLPGPRRDWQGRVGEPRSFRNPRGPSRSGRAKPRVIRSDRPDGLPVHPRCDRARDRRRPSCTSTARRGRDGQTLPLSYAVSRGLQWRKRCASEQGFAPGDAPLLAGDRGNARWMNGIVRPTYLRTAVALAVASRDDVGR